MIVLILKAHIIPSEFSIWLWERREASITFSKTSELAICSSVTEKGFLPFYTTMLVSKSPLLPRSQRSCRASKIFSRSMNLVYRSKAIVLVSSKDTGGIRSSLRLSRPS